MPLFITWNVYLCISSWILVLGKQIFVNLSVNFSIFFFFWRGRHFVRCWNTLHSTVELTCKFLRRASVIFILLIYYPFTLVPSLKYKYRNRNCISSYFLGCRCYIDFYNLSFTLFFTGGIIRIQDLCFMVITKFE